MAVQPRSGGGRGAWSSVDDFGMFFIIATAVGLCVLFYMVWDTWNAEISAWVIAWRRHEIAFLRHFTDRYDLADAQMAVANPGRVTLAQLYHISGAVGWSFRIPACALMLALGLLCFLRAAPSRYQRQFTLDTLIAEHARTFRSLSAYVGKHLKMVPPLPRPRPADYALSTAEWVASFATSNGKFDEAAARRCFAAQLGVQWTSLDAAAPHVRCMVAVMVLHRAERRTEALQFLGRMSAGLLGWDKDTPEGPEAPLSFAPEVVRIADGLLRDPRLRLPAVAVMDRHAYVNTALMALLNDARLVAGVLAPAKFVFLKLVDRPLWYALHSLGFETEGIGRYMHPNARVEADGARDHWAAERASGRPLLQPDIDRALDALRSWAVPAKQAAPKPVALPDAFITTLPNLE